MSPALIAREIIDLIGKLGPLCVAVAVYIAARQQNAWTNAVGRRASEVEDQKFRLLLLEKRMAAIQAIDEAAQDLQTHGGATPDAVRKVFEAIRVAELVFEDDVRAALEGCLRSLLRWQSHDRARARWRDEDEKKLTAAVKEMFYIEEKFSSDIVDLRTMLVNAARIRQVEPIAPSIPLS